MNTYRNQNRVLGTVILLTFLLSLLFPTSTVFADDTTPPADTSGEVGLPENEDASQEEVTAPVVETTSEAEEPTDDAALPGESDLEGVFLEEAVTENPATDVEEEPVLAQIPDGTDMVVLDEKGEAVSLATQEAADAIASSDPMWCPEGVDPIANTGGCTDSYSSMTDLLTALSGDRQPSQNGTIWVEATYDSSVAEPGSTTNITIDGNNGNFSNWRDYSLTVQGGWDGSGTGTISGTSLFSGDRFRIINWRNNVTIRDIVIDGASGGTSLEIEIDTPSTNNFDVTLENVEVRNNTNSRGASIDNDESTGSVTVNNSRFTNNGSGNNDDGLYIDAKGRVTLLNVTSTGNGDEGVEIYNTDSTVRSPVQVLGTNVFSGNTGYGLFIISDGAVTLNNITANDSINESGARVDNDEGGANSTSSVTITGTNSFSGNDEFGLEIDSRGAVTLENITADNNERQYGVNIDNDGSSASGDVTIQGTNSFSGNDDYGLAIYSRGSVFLDNITANGNRTSDGVYIDNDSGLPRDVTLIGVLSFNNNGNGDGDDGLYISSRGNVTLADVVATGNSDEGVEINNTASSTSATVMIGGTNVFSNNSRGGLLIRSDGNVSLSNVTADNGGGDGLNIENHTSNTRGFVSITGTNSFSGNTSDGIYIRTDGSIILENVTADNSTNDSGVRLDNDEGGANASSFVSITGTNSFSGNNDLGLQIYSRGEVTLENITADNNKTQGGAYIDNDEDGAVQNVTINGVNSFSGNGNSNGDEGLHIDSKGNVTVENISANSNMDHGVYIRNTASSSGATVTMNGVNVISNNADDGLIIYSDGTIKLNDVTANGNGTGNADNGAEIDNSSGNGDVLITGYYNSFSNNAGPGLDIDTKGNLDLFFATIENNNQAGGSDGATFDSSSVSSKAANVYCSIFGNNSGDGLDAWNFRGSLDFHGMDSFTDYRYNGTAGFADYDCTVPVYGCTDPTALNYNPEANTDDESCEYPTSSGGGGGGERNTGTPPNISFIPVTGGQLVPLSCDTQMTKLEMANGDFVTFADLCGYDALLDEVLEAELPSELLGGGQYGSGLNVALLHEGDRVDPLPEVTSMTVGFMVPVGMVGETFTILRWDGGDWVEENVSLENGYVMAVTSYTGTFVLVLK